MNELARKSIVKKLRELADNIENSKTNVIELSLLKHYEPCLIVEKGLFEHNLTGDSMIQIRIK